MNTLQEEIDLKSKEIHTDSYAISLGEVFSMYKDGDIDIHPEFQRFFRWTSNQKTKLIESILLNIPIPPIFVAQRQDGIWDIVDGLQRMSTILQFVGLLKDSEGQTISPLTLEETELLPSLKDKLFGDDDNQGENYFTETQRRYFKRAKLNFIIIQKESDESSKYELFQRLNTGGSSLTPQEVRSCLMVMVSSSLFHTIQELAKYEPFLQCVKLSDKNIEEQYDLELVIRFICLRNERLDSISKMSDLSVFLDKEIVKKMKDLTYNWDQEILNFKNTFDKIASQIKENAFQRYNKSNDKFSGGFLVSAFEIVALGIGNNPENVENSTIKDKVIEVWDRIEAEDISWKGYNASGRLVKTLKLGRSIFQNETV